MIHIQHYNDGRGNSRSHQISLQDEFKPTTQSINLGVSNLNVLSNRGYGETQEEAIHDLVNKVDYAMNQLRSFQEMLYLLDAGCVSLPIEEIDFSGDAIKEDQSL